MNQQEILADIIRMATHTADHANMVADMTDHRRTNAERVSGSVDAAIRGAIANGLLQVAPDAEQRLAQGYQVWPELEENQ